MKQYLSQTEVKWSWALKQGLGNPYKLHQWIWGALPDDPNARRDFLFRSDVNDGILRILLLSARSPVSQGNIAWKTTEVSGTFLGHGTYRFRLRANPTFRRSKDRRRLAIFTEPELREWFVRKIEAAGCDVREIELSAPRKLQFSKGSGNSPGTIYAVDASGMLLVHNEDAFRAAFDAGIGSAKAFGFGLLMLQPIQL